MTKARERAIKMYWGIAKEKCPFQTEEIVNGYLEGFIDCAELFEEEDKLTLTKYSRIIIDKKDECIEELETENNKLLDVINGQDVKIKELERLNSNQAESLRITMLEEEKKGNRIAELEKENAELKKKLKEKLKNIADKDLSFVAKFDALEKENAELKEKLNFSTQYYQGEKAKDQLTKAKELLERLVTVCKIVPLGTNYDVVKKAEQFLKDSEVEK